MSPFSADLPGLNLAWFYQKVKISSQKPVKYYPRRHKMTGGTTRQDEVTSLKTSLTTPVNTKQHGNNGEWRGMTGARRGNDGGSLETMATSLTRLVECFNLSDLDWKCCPPWCHGFHPVVSTLSSLVNGSKLDWKCCPLWCRGFHPPWCCGVLPGLWLEIRLEICLRGFP